MLSLVSIPFGVVNVYSGSFRCEPQAWTSGVDSTMPASTAALLGMMFFFRFLKILQQIQEPGSCCFNTFNDHKRV